MDRDTVTTRDERAELEPNSEPNPMTAPDIEMDAQPGDSAPAEIPQGDSSELPDLTVGDMETDLPLPAAPVAEETSSTESVEAAAPEEEIEIPWGEMPLPDQIGEGQIAQAETEAEALAAEGAETITPPAPPKEPVKHAWYVVHCYSGYENKVKKGLEQRINSMGMHDYIFRVVVPVEKEVEIKEGQRRNIERRVFPGYILVEMAELKEGDPESDQAWYVVRNTPGVTGFVSSGDRPVPLRQDEVDKILKRMETDEPKVHVTFRVGQVVHIIDGPFADFRGTVDNVDMTKGKVRVLVSFFGRETPVELDLLQVEKV